MSNDETEEADASSSIIEIPKNLNFGVQAAIKELIYDKMNFTNARGNLAVSNGVLTFKNLGLNGFGGAVNLNGEYNTTSPEKPTVKLDMDLTNVAFSQVFEQIETFAKFAPVLENLVGNFSAKLSLNSLLEQDMMPDLQTLVADGSLSTQSVGIKDVPALTSLVQNLQKIPLTQNLNLPDAANTTLKNLLINFNIKDGKVNTQPFNVNLGSLKLNLGGASGLDKSLAWTGTAVLPENLSIGKLQNIGFTIGGTFSKPTVKLDLANTLTNVVNDLKEQATQKITEKVDAAKASVNAEVQKRREQAIQEAENQANKLRAEAKTAGEKIVAEAQTQAQKLIDAAKNPIAKIAAETAAKKLTDEAQKKAAQLNSEADKQGTALVEKAKSVNYEL
jgi:hypothetical protein